jgi:hypothetical protein
MVLTCRPHVQVVLGDDVRVARLFAGHVAVLDDA